MRLSFLPFISLAAIGAAAVFTLGCAWVPQNARLKISPGATASEVGRGVKVAVKVHDRRPISVLGHRGMDSQYAAITTTQNLTLLFRDALIEGLARKGFNAADFDGEPGRVLTVEIHKVEYSTDLDFWRGVAKAEALLTAWMSKDGVRFEQNYQGRRKEKAVESPRASTNERLLNEAISEAVRGLLEDQSLLRFMAE